MDETYIKVRDAWKYLYRAADEEGKSVGFLLTADHDTAAAKRFFDKAIRGNGAPEHDTMNKSSANKVAIDEINGSRVVPISLRQIKYLNT